MVNLQFQLDLHLETPSFSVAPLTAWPVHTKRRSSLLNFMWGA